MLRHLSGILFVVICHAQQIELVPVRSAAVEQPLTLPGELQPYQKVTLHAGVNGFVERVLVDVGSTVKQGDLVATLSAPELIAKSAEAESRVHTAEGKKAEAEARLAGALATLERIKRASATPGAIAGNEVIQAEKSVEAAQAVLRAAESEGAAARSFVEASKQLEKYLHVTAPFSGTVTARHAHPGMLAGPSAGTSGSLLELEQISRLRLIVPLPESEAANVRRGSKVAFRVPAYAGRTFTGTVARVNRAMDPKTRTMAVEADVSNPGGLLSPGMYPEVSWSSARGGSQLMVPATAVVTTTERTFVIRSNKGKADWVDVRRGRASKDMVEVTGNLMDGDMIVKRGSDEIRNGSRLGQ